MSQMILDHAVAARFQGQTGTVELHNDEGKIIGWFTPFLPDKMKPQVSDEELKRRAQEKGGRTLQEILSDLEAR